MRAPATVWLLDSRDTPPVALAAAERWLGADGRRRLAGLSRRSRREQFVLGRALLRLAVAHARECDPGMVRMTERAHRAPRVAAGGDPAPRFSLSHSGPWIACAVHATSALGLDIEVIDTTRDMVAISEWGFHGDEHQWLLRQPDRAAAFYRLWTGKEAMIKLSHEIGSPRDLREVACAVCGDAVQPPAFAASWYHVCAAPRVALSIVSSEPMAPPVMERIDASGLIAAGRLTPVVGALAAAATSCPS